MSDQVKDCEHCDYYDGVHLETVNGVLIESQTPRCILWNCRTASNQCCVKWKG